MISSNGVGQEDGNNNANVKVVVRIRPINASENNERYSFVAEAISDHMLVFDPKIHQGERFLPPQLQRRNITGRRVKDRKYAFDHVLRSSAKNKDVFEKTTQSIVKAVLDGYNCSVFAYGATGSGKTHTMLGNESEPGVIYHTMVDLYRQINDLKGEKFFSVAVSYLEIYNETVRDLLKPNKNLPIREDKVAGVMIAGLSLHKPDTADDLLEMLHFGNKNRSQHPTDANAESSRSHAVFQVFVKQRARSFGGENQLHMAKMCLVDLAGSERAIKNRNEGARFREGANINRSLLALGNVINALASKSKGHVPYRDSKLTRLLKDSLGGNCQTVMIATVSPSSRSYDDTYNTLRYADRAKHIKADVTKNIVSINQHIVNYKKYVADLEQENKDLRDKVQLVNLSVPILLPAPFVKQFQEKLHDLFKCRKELMRCQITSEVVKKELKWKLSRKERTIKRVEKLRGVKDVVCKNQRLMERMQRRYSKEELSLLKTTQQLKEQDNSIYDLNAELASLSNADKNFKELLKMSLRFYVTESFLHDVDMHLCFVKKMARAQERQSVVNERLILSLIQMVRKQQDVLNSHDINCPDLEQQYKDCCFLVEERGVTWAQHHKTVFDVSQDNSSFMTEDEVKDDLSISDIIDIPLPKIDLNALKLGNLVSTPLLNKSLPNPVKENLMSNFGLGQLCSPRKTEKRTPLKQSLSSIVENSVTDKQQCNQSWSHVTRSANSLMKKPWVQDQQSPQKIVVSSKIGDSVEVTSNCEKTPDRGNVRKMVEIYSKGISASKQSPLPAVDNSTRSKMTSRKSLQWPKDPTVSPVITQERSHSAGNLSPKQLSPLAKDDSISEKLNHTFEIDKPAIPNTPCIDSPTSKKWWGSSPLHTNTSRSCVEHCDFSSVKCGKRSSCEKNDSVRCKLTFSNTNSSNPVKTETDTEDRNRLDGNCLMNLSEMEEDNDGHSHMNNKYHSSKVVDVLGKTRASLLPGVKESPSVNKWNRGPRTYSSIWHSLSAQHLGKGNATNNNSSLDSEHESSLPLCSSTPDSLGSTDEVKSSTPKMEVEICTPVTSRQSDTQSDKDGGREGEGRPDCIKTPEFEINPYMQTVIQSLKKHGLPSLTERLSMGPTTSGLQAVQIAPTLQTGHRERSPLRTLDANSSKYNTKASFKTKVTSFPEKPKVARMTLQPPIHTNDNTSDVYSMKNRLNRLKERRHQREFAAKPYSRETTLTAKLYSRETILSNQGQRLAAALQQKPKGKFGSSSQGVPSSSSTAHTKPSYMLSTFAASQKANGPDKDKGTSSTFGQNSQPQRRPFTGFRNQSSLPWLKS